MEPLRCPGEPYDLTPFLCRARQAKGYEKCPGCPNRERGASAVPVPAPAAQPVFEPLEASAYGRELEVAAPPRAVERLARVPQAAAGLAGAGVLGGLWHAARRVYDYF